MFSFILILSIFCDDECDIFFCFEGEIKTTLGELIDRKSMDWKQWDPKKKKYKSKKCGQLFIRYANIIKKYSFTSFLSGGLEVQMMVAIDFTGSNGMQYLNMFCLHDSSMFDFFCDNI